MKKTNFSLGIVFIAVAFLFVACEKSSEIKDNNSKSNNLKFEGIQVAQAGTNTQIEFQGQLIHVMDIGNAYLWQGDILLNKKDIANANYKTKLKGAAVLNRDWPKGIVYYKIQSGLSNQQRIIDAINLIQNNALGLTFVNDPIATNYIEFIDGGSSTYSDWIGYKGGRQIIGLANWANFGNTAHEILHALGIFHEQSRTDRENYISVNYNNIEPSWRYQYYTYTQQGYSGLNYGTFDFDSIMLYPSDNSYNGMWSMTDKQGIPFSAQRDHLSTVDISLLNRLYNPTWFNVIITGPSKATNSGRYTWSALTSSARGVLTPLTYKWEYTYNNINWWSLGTTQSITVPMPMDLDLQMRVTITSANNISCSCEKIVINMSNIKKN